MIDCEKVVGNLQILRTWCAVNPRHGMGLDSGECEKAVGWLDDALALLKAYQPRVLTLDEIEDGESYWFEGESYWCSDGKEFVTRPVICVHREDDAQKPYITFVWQFGTFSWELEDYGKTWRCWTSRPTDEQRKAVKWDER